MSSDSASDGWFTQFTFPTGYAVMANGDIVTSDGKPRDVDDLHLRMAQEAAENSGREITFRFRAPRPDELDDLKAQGIQ